MDDQDCLFIINNRISQKMKDIMRIKSLLSEEIETLINQQIKKEAQSKIS